MPWKEKTVEEKRLEFVVAAISREDSMSSLCREYGITRRTGYKWIERYKESGILSDQSRAPHRKPRKTLPEKEEQVLSVRSEHPTWGPRKIKRFLENKGYTDLPATSTIADILKRNGLITPENSIAHIPYKRFEMKYPNDMWQMDFKGHFAMLNGDRCHPLTITDDCTRKLLCLDAYDNERLEVVRKSLLRVFAEYGLPDAILSDNGAPWGDSQKGYTQFEIWMMQLGILPMHGRPLHPQTQGKEERFHKTLKEDVLNRTVIRDLKHAQEIFDAYRLCFNTERPHEALGLDVPDSRYCLSKRSLPDKIGEPEYSSGTNLRKVNYKGYISINNCRYYLSESFIGKYLELVYTGDDIVWLCYGKFRVGIIDLKERLFTSRKIYLR